MKSANNYGKRGKRMVHEIEVRCGKCNNENVDHLGQKQTGDHPVEVFQCSCSAITLLAVLTDHVGGQPTAQEYAN